MRSSRVRFGHMHTTTYSLPCISGCRKNDFIECLMQIWLIAVWTQSKSQLFYYFIRNRFTFYFVKDTAAAAARTHILVRTEIIKFSIREHPATWYRSQYDIFCVFSILNFIMPFNCWGWKIKTFVVFMSIQIHFIIYTIRFFLTVHVIKIDCQLIYSIKHWSL